MSLHRSYFGDQNAGLSSQVPTRLNFESNSMTKRILETLSGGVPQLEVFRQVSSVFTFLIRNRKSSTCTYHCKGTANIACCPLKRVCNRSEMVQIGTAANMHMKTSYGESCPLRTLKNIWDRFMPNAMLGSFSSGIGLLAMTMSESRIYSKCYVCTWRALCQLLKHVRGTAIDMNAMLNDRVEAFMIKDVCRVNNWICCG